MGMQINDQQQTWGMQGPCRGLAADDPTLTARAGARLSAKSFQAVRGTPKYKNGKVMTLAAAVDLRYRRLPYIGKAHG